MCCCGEICTIFFLTVGGTTLYVLTCVISARLLEGTEAADSPFHYLKLFLICIGVFILLSVAATPFFYGVCWYRIQQVQGNSVHARGIFSCYASFRKLWSVLLLNSILIIKKLYIIVPAATLSAFCFHISGQVDDRTNGGAAYYVTFVLAVLVTVGMLGVTLVYNARYAAVPYLYVLEPGRSALELIDTSKRFMRGNIRYLSEVMLSLSGWMLPCLIIFPMIFIVPYIQMVYAAAVNEIILSEREKEGDSGESGDSGRMLFLPEKTS